ncbi:hypothetical protein CBP36_20090 (plasmid) [Acidovorax carolinensis]|jgi:hypothetical protein|uniref:Uncharacterized protein n=1 Tax=Acidovorax carolinensis TaxID=553814 RepID=A0A240UJR9_9BURK|nr:hypothetical protein [Acidovorax carolinensis]ART57213.1 hypothetical protein CBP35_20070 [Acidovorax carolinensis]ART61269.1 hypothetical protein CBP36_20090 [Acidovorax carolinensis]
MPRKQTEAAARGLEFIAAGMTLREAAARVGLAPSTLTRAKKRAGMKHGNAGRRAKQQEPES